MSLRLARTLIYLADALALAVSAAMLGWMVL